MNTAEVVILRVGDPPAWEDIAEQLLSHSREPIRWCLMERGTSNGNPAVMLAVQTSDDEVRPSWVSAEMTYATFLAVAAAFAGGVDRMEQGA